MGHRARIPLLMDAKELGRREIGIGDGVAISQVTEWSNIRWWPENTNSSGGEVCFHQWKCQSGNWAMHIQADWNSISDLLCFVCSCSVVALRQIIYLKFPGGKIGLFVEIEISQYCVSCNNSSDGGADGEVCFHQWKCQLRNTYVSWLEFYIGFTLFCCIRGPVLVMLFIWEKLFIWRFWLKTSVIGTLLRYVNWIPWDVIYLHQVVKREDG